MLRVAIWAKTIRPSATIQVTTMELVIGNPKGRAISTALWGKPFSACASAAGEEAASGWGGVAPSALQPIRGAPAKNSDTKMILMTLIFLNRCSKGHYALRCQTDVLKSKPGKAA